MSRAISNFAFASALAVTALVGCGDDDGPADTGSPDTGPRDLGMPDPDTGMPERDMGMPDPDAGAEDPGESRARDAASEELVDMRLWIALADSLFDFDPTIDPAMSPDANAIRIQMRVMALAPCATASVSGATVTVDFGAPPGCALATGITVSGRVTATLTKTGAETTITLEAMGVTVNGRSLAGTIVFRTTDGSAFAVSKTGGATTFDLMIMGGMGRFTASGTVTTTRTTPSTTITVSGVVWDRGACYPRAGTITITYMLPRTVTQTITFDATTPTTGIATRTSSRGAVASYMLPAYAGCPPMAMPPRCGDRNMDAGEECDDGNTRDGDGCSAMCRTETMTVPEDCAVAGDEDLDGAGDCADSDCAALPACAGCMPSSTAPRLDPGPAGLPIEGLVLWLRADVGVSLNASGEVCAWQNQVGAEVFLPSPAGNPALVADWRPGRAAIRAETGESLVAGSLLGIAPMSGRTFFAVTEVVDPAARVVPLQQGQMGSDRVYVGLDHNTYMTAGGLYGSYVSGGSFDSAVPTTMGNRAIEALVVDPLVLDAPNASVLHYFNDGAPSELTYRCCVTTVLDHSPMDHTFVAWAVAGPTLQAEAIAYDRPLAFEERRLVEQYLAMRYGITLRE